MKYLICCKSCSDAEKKKAVKAVQKKVMRSRVVNESVRMDGRGLTDVGEHHGLGHRPVDHVEVDALHVGPGAGVSIPVPRATDVVGRLECPCGQSHPAQPVQQVQPGEPGADDDDVDVSAPGRGSFGCLGVGHGRPPLLELLAVPRGAVSHGGPDGDDRRRRARIGEPGTSRDVVGD